MIRSFIRAAATIAVFASVPAFGQVVKDPFPQPLHATDDVIKVNYVEFASIPDVDGQAARLMLLGDEPGTKRLFANDQFGILYSISYDGKNVVKYLDLRDAKWKLSVQSEQSERGFQSFAFHPDFTKRGAKGYGKFYTYLDTADMTPKADFAPIGATTHTHDTILLEWTAKNPAAATYDGDAPRELFRAAQPFWNHNGGEIAFDPLLKSSDKDYGLLYVGLADGGSGGDPLKSAQNLAVAFGKIMRIDPMGTNSANHKYGIPASNPFVNRKDALGEVYALGVRNPQRIFWDPKNHNMFMSDIGQNTIEEISPVTAGANLGWNIWEGSARFVQGQGVDTHDLRSDKSMTYPIAEFDHTDPILQRGAAVIGGYVYRRTEIPQLNGKLIFGDNPSGEIFYVDADHLPNGGPDAIRRILLNDKGEAKTLLQIIKDKNTQQGKQPAGRADLHFGQGPNGEIYIMDKRDGVIRLLVK